MGRSHRRAGAAVLIVALVLGACGAAKSATQRAAELVADENALATTTTDAPKRPAPLTGKPIDSDDASRVAVSVKVDNSPEGRPQAGLEKADIIYEERVEGGVTRFIAVFQSRDSELVGPIRSLRTTDPAVVSAFGGVFAFSDGVALTLSRLKGAPVSVVSERGGSEPFTYPKGKRRPYATFAATARLRKEGKDGAKEPKRAFSFLVKGEAFAPSGVARATKATIDYGGRTKALFEWDMATGTWLRSTNGSPHLLADGTRLAFSNVIVQKVPYSSVGYKDSTRHPVEEAMVVGQGEAFVLSGGKQVKARWSKPSPEAVTVFTDSTGQPIKLVAGSTMIALAPTTAPISIS